MSGLPQYIELAYRADGYYYRIDSAQWHGCRTLNNSMPRSEAPEHLRAVVMRIGGAFGMTIREDQISVFGRHAIYKEYRG